MKRILLPLIFLLPLLSVAQNDWAPVGAKWNFLYLAFGGPEIVNGSLQSVSDTVVLGKECRKLIGDVGCSPMNYNGTYVYSEGQKYYYYNADVDTFFLLYNFELNPTQSWTIFFTDWNSQIDSIVATVADTSSILINGEMLKLQTIYESGIGWYFLGNQFIERVGSTTFIFPQAGFCDPPVGSVVCYQDSIVGLYETGVAPYCDWTNIGINENQISQLEIFPNPTHDFLYLNPDSYRDASQKLNYKILDFTGRVILSGKTEKEINVKTLLPGYYLVVFEDKVNRAFIKF